MKPNVRDTNVELLRLVAIFMVLVLHADFISLDIPLQAEILANPEGTFFKYFF